MSFTYQAWEQKQDFKRVFLSGSAGFGAGLYLGYVGSCSAWGASTISVLAGEAALGGLVLASYPVLGSSMSALPISFFFLLFIGCGKVNVMAVEKGLSRPLPSVCLQFTAAIGILISIIYGVIIFSKMLSELHKISVWRALGSTLLGLGTSLVLTMIILKTAIDFF